MAALSSECIRLELLQQSGLFPKSVHRPLLSFPQVQTRASSHPARGSVRSTARNRGPRWSAPCPAPWASGSKPCRLQPTAARPPGSGLPPRSPSPTACRVRRGCRCYCRRRRLSLSLSVCLCLSCFKTQLYKWIRSRLL